MTTLLFSAGDASGDVHTAGLIRALRERLPGLRALGIGGVAMEKAGALLLVHQRELAVGGLLETLGTAGRAIRAWRRMGRALREERPALAVLVDSPDLNLPLARRIRRARVPILYYVSPQVWAWRPGRIRKLARRVDRMAVIFPFETRVYAGTGLPVDFVGHPLSESTADFAAAHDREAARASLGLPQEPRVVVLLAGSRHNELRHSLPLFLETARVLHARDPGVVFVLALAPTLEREDALAHLRAARLPEALRLELVEGRTWEAVRAADVALAKPGTVTLEVALLGRPLVAAGRANALSAAIARRVVHLPSWTMPNLILGAPVVPEFLQEAARPERVAAALSELFAGPARELQLARLARLRERLGGGGAAERTAEIVLEMLREEAPRR